MYRAIIADDELKVLDLILSIGNWEELGIEVVETCVDGEETLRAILRHKPDIVITDIRMPVHDGLELVRLTREAGIDAQFIIVSGYRNFQYAHTALQYNVSDYLLKPIDEVELNKTLLRSISKISEKAKQEKRHEHYVRLVDEKESQIRSTLVNEIETNTFDLSDLQAFNERYRTDFQNQLFQVCVVNTNDPNLHDSNDAFNRQLEEIFHSVFSNWCRYFPVFKEEGCFVFLNYASSSVTDLRTSLSVMANKVRAMSALFGSFSIVLGVGRSVERLSDLPLSFNEAVIHEMAKLVLGWDKIIVSLPMSLSESKLPDLSYSQERLIDTALDNFDLTFFASWFDEEREKSQRNAINPVLLQDLFLLLIKKLFAHHASSADGIAIRKTITRSHNVNEAWLYLQQVYQKTLTSALNKKKQEEERPIRLAKQYIRMHIDTALTLTEVADHVGFNATYFSTLFKKTTGQNFGDYLTQVRIEEAKSLLKDTDHQMKHIAELVGFSNSHYFARVFKKETGLRPTEYRKLYW